MKKIFNKKHGFTLIELLVVIAILTVLFAITIIAINPVRQFAKANNTQRRSDVNAILNAIYQYAADNNGNLPVFIPSTSTVQIGDPNGCVNIDAGFCAGSGSTTSCVDLGSATTTLLAPTYLASIPYDPQVGNASSTHYAMTASTAGNRITIIACSSENSEAIRVTR